MTMEVSNPSNHPLAGHTSAFLAWLGLAVSLVVAFSLWQILSGWTPTPFVSPYQIAGITIPWESFIPVIAVIVYWLMWKITLHRPKTAFYALLDFLGSALIAVVVLGAFLSWFPFTRPFYSRLGLPECPVTLTTILVIFWFLPLAVWDFWKNQMERAMYSHDALILETASSQRPTVQVANLDANPNGFTVLALPNKPGQEIIWDYRDVPQAPVV